MFKAKYRYSKYVTGYTLKRMFDQVYKDKLLGTLKLSIQYHFERDLFENEVMYIYTDRPGLLVGKEEENYNKLKELYLKTDPKCKDIRVFETGYLNVN